MDHLSDLLLNDDNDSSVTDQEAAAYIQSNIQPKTEPSQPPQQPQQPQQQPLQQRPNIPQLMHHLQCKFRITKIEI